MQDLMQFLLNRTSLANVLKDEDGLMICCSEHLVYSLPGVILGDNVEVKFQDSVFSNQALEDIESLESYLKFLEGKGLFEEKGLHPRALEMVKRERHLAKVACLVEIQEVLGRLETNNPINLSGDTGIEFLLRALLRDRIKAMQSTINNSLKLRENPAVLSFLEAPSSKDAFELIAYDLEVRDALPTFKEGIDGMFRVLRSFAKLLIEQLSKDIEEIHEEVLKIDEELGEDKDAKSGVTPDMRELARAGMKSINAIKAMAKNPNPGNMGPGIGFLEIGPDGVQAMELPPDLLLGALRNTIMEEDLPPFGSNPLDPDTDGDGLSDVDEDPNLH